MTRKYSGRGGQQKGRKKDDPRLTTDSQKNDPVIDDGFDEIDPADFFDPEEFGIRRNVNSARHG